LGTMDGVRVRSSALDLTILGQVDPNGKSNQAGFDSGRAVVETRNGMSCARCRGACCFIFASYYRTSSCWYFCWYRQQSTMNITLNSNGYSGGRVSARGTK
jgi:hypothetical protein